MTVKTFKVIDSTHDYALKNFDQLSSETVIVAMKQVFGRGQRSNGWESNEGGLFYSLILKDVQQDPIRWIQKTSVAIKRVLKDYNIDTHIKYPNDIIWNNHKLGGILITQKNNGAVISIGLNVNQDGFYQEKKAISMKLILDQTLDLSNITSQVTNAILWVIKQNEDVSSEYLESLNLNNKTVNKKKIVHVDEQLNVLFKDGTKTTLDNLNTTNLYYGGRIKTMILMSLFIALLSSTSWFAIPFIPGLPPITLQTLWVLMIATTLDLRSGLITITIYILMGTIGLPVFSGGSSGITQYYGYILGFIPMMIITNVGQRLVRRPWSTYVQPFILSISTITLYIIGTSYLMLLTELPFMPTLLSHWIFLPGDIVKVLVVIYVSRLISKTDYIKSIKSYINQ